MPLLSPGVAALSPDSAGWGAVSVYVASISARHVRIDGQLVPMASFSISKGYLPVVTSACCRRANVGLASGT